MLHIMQNKVKSISVRWAADFGNFLSKWDYSPERICHNETDICEGDVDPPEFMNTYIHLTEITLKCGKHEDVVSGGTCFFSVLGKEPNR